MGAPAEITTGFEGVKKEHWTEMWYFGRIRTSSKISRSLEMAINLKIQFEQVMFLEDYI